MSSVAEIESAIERLGVAEFEKLKNWMERYADQRGQTAEKSRLNGVRNTAGCLSEEDAEDFARAVAEVGQDVADTRGLRQGGFKLR